MRLAAGGPNDDDLHLYEHNGRKRIPSLLCRVDCDSITTEKRVVLAKTEKTQEIFICQLCN